VEEAGIRYILRRNPVRVEEMEKSRLAKRRALEDLFGRRTLFIGAFKSQGSHCVGKVKAR